jgi:hypothetical protein
MATSNATRVKGWLPSCAPPSEVQGDRAVWTGTRVHRTSESRYRGEPPWRTAASVRKAPGPWAVPIGAGSERARSLMSSSGSADHEYLVEPAEGDRLWRQLAQLSVFEGVSPKASR